MGVSFNKSKQKWKAYSTAHYKQHHIGYFESREQALEAFQEYRAANPLPKRVWKEPPRTEKTCPYCSQAFMALRPDHVMCSTPECILEHRRQDYRRKHNQKIAWRRRYESDPKRKEQRRIAARAYYRAHPKKYDPEEYKRNIHTHTAGRQNYRARKLSNPGELTRQDIAIVFKQCKQTCVGCNQHFPFLTVDHKVPVSKGGANSRDNIQPLCRKCNSSKGTKVMFAACRIQDKSLYLESLDNGLTLA